MSSDICPSKISYLTNPIVFHRKIPAWFWYRWARMFFPPQSGLAGARVSSLFDLLVNRKKASRWCSRIYTLAFGGTAGYNSGVHTPLGCWDWGYRQPLARLEQGASHGWGVTGQGHVRRGEQEANWASPGLLLPVLHMSVLAPLWLKEWWRRNAPALPFPAASHLPSSGFSSSGCSHWCLHTW